MGVLSVCSAVYVLCSTVLCMLLLLLLLLLLVLLLLLLLLLLVVLLLLALCVICAQACHGRYDATASPCLEIAGVCSVGKHLPLPATVDDVRKLFRYPAV